MADGKSFKVWLKRKKVTDDPEGQLIGDMRGDPDLPNFDNFGRITSYVHLKSRDDPKVVGAVLGVWRRFINWHCRAQERSPRVAHRGA